MTACSHACEEDHEHEEEDPCMAHHMAVMEKGRVLLDKLLLQETRIIGARQKIAKSIRNSTVPECDITNNAPLDPIDSKNVCFEIGAEDVAGFLCTGSKTFLLLIPCDTPPGFDPIDIFDAFEETANETTLGTVRFLRMKGAFCVCGKCGQKTTGALRSMAMILRVTPSIIISGGSGISGFISLPFSDFESARSEMRKIVLK